MILQSENPHFPIDGDPHVYQVFGLLGHVGIDWDVPVGTPIRAILNGTVIWAVQDSKVYGRYVTILHNDGYASLYAHLSKILAHKDDVVQGGTVIGLSGGAVGADGSGQSTGWHLHLEVRVPGHLDHNKYNVDPILYIKSYMER
jgi:murein DD-endopeptidase MepM/ murein hydrolase activator NlpD